MLGVPFSAVHSVSHLKHAYNLSGHFQRHAAVKIGTPCCLSRSLLDRADAGESAKDLLTSGAGAGARRACGEGQGLQSCACCKCNAKPKRRLRLRLSFSNENDAVLAIASSRCTLIWTTPSPITDHPQSCLLYTSPSPRD